MNKNISKNLIRIRQERGLPTKSVAVMLQIEEKNYIKWEMGLEEPTVDDIMKIASAYNIDYLDIVAEVTSHEVLQKTSNNVKEEKYKKTNIFF